MSSTSHTTRPPKVPLEILQFVDGNGFSVSHRFTGVANGASVDLFFKNPAGSGRQVFLVATEVIVFGQCHVDIYRENTVTVSGTPITPVNLNFEKVISSVANVEYGGTYALGTLTLQTVCPGGAKVRAVGAATEVGETVVIPEDFNFLVRVTNQSGTATDLSVRIIWWEEDDY